jgi:hypothetical protein
MSAITDKARDFWDRISPRERRLVVIGAIAAPLTLAVWLGLEITDGLDAMQHRNDKMRKALDALVDIRAKGVVHEDADEIVWTPEPLGKGTSLDTYLDKAAKKTGYQLKGTQPHPDVTRNGFVTTSVSCSLDDITIDQLKNFLMEVEMGSRVVAVTHIELRRDFRQKDKLDVSLEVSSYAKEAVKGEGSAAGTDEKKEGG